MRIRTVFSMVLFVAIGCLLLSAGGQFASAQAMKFKINTDASGYSEPVWPEYSKPASITVWTWIANADKLGPLFQKAFPSIKVDVKSVGQGQPEYTKLATAIQAGSGAPDVVQVEFQALPQFVETGGLLDISQYVGDVKPLFPEWTWNQVFLNWEALCNTSGRRTRRTDLPQGSVRQVQYPGSEDVGGIRARWSTPSPGRPSKIPYLHCLERRRRDQRTALARRSFPIQEYG